MHKSKLFPILLVLLLCSCFVRASAAYGEDQQSIRGHWEGVIEIKSMELGIIIDFFKNEESTLTGNIDIPMQGAKDMALSNIEIEGNALSFDFPGAPGKASFKGNLSEDGNTISGDFTQFGKAYIFKLERKGKVEPAEKKRTPEEALEGFKKFVIDSMEKWSVPGLAIAIFKEDRIILSEGFGLRNIRENLPVTPNTLFAIGSASKAFTATLLGILVDEGRIEWDEPVSSYLPTFKLNDNFASQRMTPRDLVTHRSGLPRHDLMWYGSPFSRAEIFERLSYLEPNEDFRATFQYQNLMFMTAGYLAGQVMDSTWEKLIQNRILDPLLMKDTNFSVRESQKADDFALPYEEEEEEEMKKESEKHKKKGEKVEEGKGKKKVKEMKFRNIDNIGPAGSINSNVVDMAQWLKFNISKGKLNKKQIISEASLGDIHSPQMVIKGGIFYQLFAFKEMPYMMYGMGWFIQPYRGYRLLHHGGNIDGFSAMMSFMPDEKIGVVVLTNLNGTLLPLVASLNAYDRLLGLEEIDWNGRFKLKWDMFKGEIEKSHKKEEILRKEGTKLAHKLEEYTGIYEHPAYGILNVDLDKRALEVNYNNLNSPLEHWHYEIFRALDEPLKGMKFKFMSNDRGDVDQVSVTLESNVSEIAFKRKAPESMKDPKFLEQFAGEYELIGMTVNVELRVDGVLTLTVPGQPTYELEPYLGTEFNLKGYSGFSVRFNIKEGKVMEAIFIQPNGVFTATRK